MAENEMVAKAGAPQSVRFSAWLGRLLPCRAGWWLRNKERAGPLDTEMVKRHGIGYTASLLRSKWRLCLSLAKPGDLRGV